MALSVVEGTILRVLLGFFRKGLQPLKEARARRGPGVKPRLFTRPVTRESGSGLNGA